MWSRVAGVSSLASYVRPRLLPSLQHGARLSSMVEPPGNEGMVPPYQRNPNESSEIKRARLLYQSRKRGILENDLLLSTFAKKHLSSLDEESLNAYDVLINDSGNEWNIYYWVTGARPVPHEFNTPVMRLLKEHAGNADREQRFRQPPLEQAPL